MLPDTPIFDSGAWGEYLRAEDHHDDFGDYDLSRGHYEFTKGKREKREPQPTEAG